MTTNCHNCKTYVALVPEGSILRAYNIARDGFTTTDERHVCGESDRRAY